MSSRTFAPLAALLLVLALLTSACGGAASPTAAPTQPAAKPATAPTQPAAAPTQPAAKPAAATPAAAATSAAPPSGPAKKLRFGTPVKETFPYLPLVIADQKGFWKAQNLEVEWVPFQGGGPMNQAVAAGEIKSGMANAAVFSQLVSKGVKGKIVAEALGVPANMVVIVPGNSPIKSLKDLEGKRVGITSFGSGTDMFALNIAAANHWDPNTGFKRVPLGGLDALSAALQTNQIDAMLWTLEGAFSLEEKMGARIVDTVATVVPKFAFEDIFFTDELLADPALVQGFLRGWFQAVDYMKKNKDETVAIGAQSFNMSKDILSKVYDRTMPAMSTDGTVDPAGVKAALDGLVATGGIEKPPAFDEIVSTKYTPVKP